MLSIYCAHPISGLTWDEVVDYYKNIKTTLQDIGLEVFQPMTGKNAIRTEIGERFQPADFRAEVATNHAIIERDRWMVEHCDLLYLDLTGVKNISIGCMMELAWAHLLGKYTIVIMEEGNIHRHAFVVEAADIVFDFPQKAIDYLKIFVKQEI